MLARRARGSPHRKGRLSPARPNHRQQRRARYYYYHFSLYEFPPKIYPGSLGKQPQDCELWAARWFALFFLVCVLLRYNSHTIESSLAKYTILWFLVRSQSWATATTIEFQNFLLIGKEQAPPAPPPAPAAADLLSVPPGLAGLTVLHVVLGGSVPHPRGVSALPASRWLKCVPSGGRPRFIHLGWWVSGSASLFSKGVFESILGCSPPCLASGVLPWGPHDILSQNVVQECSPSLSLGQLRSQT